VVEAGRVVEWLLIVVIFAVIPFLLTMRPGGRWERVAQWALERLQPVEAFDDLAAELYQAARRERLRADLYRVEQLLLTDAAKSATRQLGNRMAYDQLRHELEESSRLAPTWAVATPVPRSNDYRPSVRVDAVGSGASRSGSRVEVLEVRWRG